MNKSVILVSAGSFHPHWRARRTFHQAVAQLPDTIVQQVSSVEDLLRHDPAALHVVGLYFHRQRISAQALDWLRNYVAGGGGLFAVHSASASFKGEPAYYELLGGRFVEHGPVGDFTVEQASGEDAIFGELSPFTLHDELYRHEYDPNNTVHFFTRVEGVLEPVVWTRHWGEGRVCYLSLGHVARGLSLPPVQQIVRQGLTWACRLGEAARS